MHDRRRSHAFASSIEPVGTHDIRRTQKRTISADLETSAFAVSHSDVRTSGRKMQDRA